uniref:Importin subunit alpha n=1 Tax=Glossina austeni TaxID=7395 RepID=A0A1A9VIL1_GLOAU
MSLNRLNSYKNNTIDTNESRLRRHEVTVELRKSKKEDHLLKRRNINEEDQSSPIKVLPKVASPADPSVDRIFENIRSSDSKRQFAGLLAARKLLSNEQHPPIDLMIDNGIVPLCVEFLQKVECPHIQFEAAWALTNISSGTSEQTGCVVASNAVPHFVNLLECEYIYIAEQAVWALGNIAGDGPTARDIVIENNAIDGILRLLDKNSTIASLSLERNLVWLMSNLCRNKSPMPSFEQINRLLPSLAKLLWGFDAQVITDTCWALSYLSDDNEIKIQAVIDADTVPRLVSLLDTDHPNVMVPALRTIGNIVTGTDQQTDVVIAAGGLQRLKKLLKHSKEMIVKESAWTVSNIMAGSSKQIQAVMDAGIFRELCHVLQNGDFKSQKEAAYAISNMTTSGTYEQLVHVIEKYQILRPFCGLLEAKDSRTILVVLTGLVEIFAMTDIRSAAGDIERLCVTIEEIGALDKLENLQRHENQDIYKKAYFLLDTYFSENETAEAKLVPRQTQGTLEFTVEKLDVPKGGFTF